MRALMMVLRPQVQVDFISSMVSAISKRRREPSKRRLLKSVREAVADHVAAEIIDDSRELVYLVGGQELGLVDQNPVYHGICLPEHLACHLVDVCLVIYPAAFALDAYARADYVGRLAGVYERFEAYVAHAALFEIICCREQQGSLCRAHCAVSEIEFPFAVHLWWCLVGVEKKSAQR